MKKSAVLTFVTLVIAGVSVSAAPRLMSNEPLDYLIKADTLNRWSIGFDLRSADRTVDIGGYEQDMTEGQYMFYTGYDVANWVSVYGLLGWTDAKFAQGGSEGDAAFGGGARFLLIDHDILDSRAYLDRFRLAANASVTLNGSEYYGEDISWAEWLASLTVGIVNEAEGNKDYWWQAVGVYGGLGFQSLQSSDFEQVGENIGVLGGLELYLTNRTSLDIAYEYYGDDSVIAGSFNLSL